jgi:hypothetical protein
MVTVCCEPVSPAGAARADTRVVRHMRNHIKLVGILHTVYNALTVLTGLGFIITWLLVSAGVSGGAAASGEVPAEGAAALMAFLSGLGIIAGCTILVPGLPGFLAGVACLRHRPWSRLVLIIVSALHIITLVPTSIALGVYSLWVLLHEDTKAIFEGYDWIPKDTGPTPPAAV